MDEPRLATIEGRKVRVVERTPPIPPALHLLLDGGRDRDGRVWRPLRVVTRQPLTLGGAARRCLAEDHRLAPWLGGYFTDRAGRVLTLQLQACRDCGAVCVRDRTVDMLPVTHMPKRLPLQRRDHIIGWYAGNRPAQRIYQ